jgi:hypothetical protein
VVAKGNSTASLGGRWIGRALAARIASERAAEAAAKAKRAKAERKAIAEAQKIVAVWNARQAGGRALWLYPTIGAGYRGRTARKGEGPATACAMVMV